MPTLCYKRVESEISPIFLVDQEICSVCLSKFLLKKYRGLRL